MTTSVGQCKLCGGFYRLVDGRFGPHDSIKTGRPCRGRWPRESTLDDYPVGMDHNPHDLVGGKFESNRRKF